MKRFLLTSLLCALCFFGASKLKAAEVADTRPMWGVRAALDINIPGHWHGESGSIKMYKSGCGFSAGAVCNIWLGHNFYLEPGVTLFYDTYSYDNLIISGEPNNDGYVSDPSLYKAGFRIPVVAGYTFSLSDRLSMSVFTGPELSYAFAGKIRLTDDEQDLLGAFPTGLFGDFQRRVDCAWKIGFGVPFGQWFASVEGSIGMTDLLKTDLSFRENRLCFALTRYF